jgi:hypothetical protein
MNPRSLVITLLVCLSPVPADAILEANVLPQNFTPVTTGAGVNVLWPSAVTTRFEIRTITRTREHQPEACLLLISGTLKLQLRQSDIDEWQMEREGPYSLNLSHRWHPGAKAYLAWFPQGRFLASLDEPSWRGHLQGLLSQNPGKLRFEFNDDSQTNPQMLQVMGRRTRLLGYETRNQDHDADASATLQVWIELDEGILVYGLTGPVRDVLQSRNDFSRLATSMDSVTVP